MINPMRKIGFILFALTFVVSANAINTPFRDAIEARKEAFETHREELASKAAQRRESFKSEREAFKEKLSELKDDRRKKILEKADVRIEALNKKHTTKMNEILVLLNDVLVRLDGKVASATATGKDTTSASTAIATARTTVSTAQTAVSEQSAKDYTPTITDEASLGSVMSATMKTFNSDLKAVHKLVMNAKQDVRKAAGTVLLLK